MLMRVACKRTRGQQKGELTIVASTNMTTDAPNIILFMPAAEWFLRSIIMADEVAKRNTSSPVEIACDNGQLMVTANALAFTPYRMHSTKMETSVTASSPIAMS